MAFFNNRRKDFSIQLPKQSVANGAFTVTDSANIDFTYALNNLTANLTTTGISAGTYGDSTHIPILTLDSYGRVTGVSTTTFSASGIALEVNGTPNFSQVLLNLKSGTDIAVVDNLDGSVSFNYTGTGGGAVWGSITGTLTSQTDLITYLDSNYVPYTGATSNVNLGLFDITAAHLIKDGGVATQFLKADGSVDNNIYLTSADLPTTLELFATNAASDVPTYLRLVNNISSPYYNTTAVDIPTGAITISNQFIAALISDPNIISGNPGIFNITTVGNIRRILGTGTAVFYFEVYKRDSLGIETFITVSNNTLAPTSPIYAEFSAVALWNDGVFLNTDRVVLKFYGTRIPTGSDPSYEFQFGGLTPVRTIAAIPTAVIPNIFLADLADVENVAPLPNESLYWNDTAQLWEHSLVNDLIVATKSVQNISSNLELVGDLLAPGNNKVYGTDGTGVKGWKADPTGGGNSIGELTGDVTTPAATAPSQSVAATLAANLKTGSFGITADGITSIIQVGQATASVTMNYSGTISGWSISANAIGSIQFDIWKASGVIPVFADSIVASAPPTLTAAQFITSTTMTGWTLSFVAGDVFGFYVNSISTLKNATLTVRTIKS